MFPTTHQSQTDNWLFTEGWKLLGKREWGPH